MQIHGSQKAFFLNFSTEVTGEEVPPLSSATSHLSSSVREPTSKRQCPQFYLFNDDDISTSSSLGSANSTFRRSCKKEKQIITTDSVVDTTKKQVQDHSRGSN